MSYDAFSLLSIWCPNYVSMAIGRTCTHLNVLHYYMYMKLFEFIIFKYYRRKIIIKFHFEKCMVWGGLYSLLYSSAARDLWKDSRLMNEELDNLVFDLKYKLPFFNFIYLFIIYLLWDFPEKHLNCQWLKVISTSLNVLNTWLKVKLMLHTFWFGFTKS